MNVNKYGHLEDSWVDLPGSERRPTARTIMQEDPVNSDEYAQVTVMYRGDHPTPALLTYAVGHHLSVRSEHGLLKLYGRIGDLMAMFETDLTHVVTNDGTSFRHRTGPIRVPRDVAEDVTAVLGLDNRPQAHSYAHIYEAQPRISWSMAQLAQAYNLPNNDGSGQAMAFLCLGGGIRPADLGAAAGNLHIVLIDGATNQFTGNPNSADGENALDAETQLGVCPGASCSMIIAPNTDAGFVDGVAAMSKLNLAAGSISWGSPSSDWTAQARAAIDAILQSCPFPVFVASGDNGADDGTGSPMVDYPAESPYAVGAGGTSLEAFQDGTLRNEAAWSGSGGGFSKNYAQPSWQPANSQGSGRMSPDVASDADPATGVPTTINGQTYVFGGTSEAAPFWAATWARLKAAGLALTGDIHAALYGAKQGLYPVTSGSNAGYQATGQPNPVCGLGTPNGAALLAALQPAPPTPVLASVAISGVTSPTAGRPSIYTALVQPTTIAPTAPTYSWALDGIPVPANGPTLTWVPSAVGPHTLRCAASLDGQSVAGTLQVDVAAAAPPPSGVTWAPLAGDVGTPFFRALIADPVTTLDPATPTGALLRMILGNYTDFDPSKPSVGQLLTFFLQQPSIGLSAEMVTAFNNPPSGMGWGLYLDGKAFAGTMEYTRFLRTRIPRRPVWEGLE